MRRPLLALLLPGLLAACSTPPTPQGYDPAQKAANYSQNQGQSGDGQTPQASFWSTDARKKTLTNQPPIDTLQSVNPAAPANPAK